jgi:predicted nucleic acid-binding protein
MSKAALKAGLVDTRLLLDILNATVEATRFVVETYPSTLFQVSEFSVMVAFASAKDVTECAERQAFFNRNIVHNLSARIVRRARKLLSSLPALPSPISADDAIIAATALEHSLPLYTLDPTRFNAVPGLATVRPY